MSLRKEILKGNMPLQISTSKNIRSNYKKTMKDRDYSPVSWKKYFEKSENVEFGGNKFRVYRSGNSGPLIVLLHGGGFSALTWALFSLEIKNRVDCQVLAIDLRGHGDTVTTNDEDLSKETLTSDIGLVLLHLFGEDVPPVVLVGHSMGGAISVHTASNGHIPSLVGLCVIDVVEGTAMQALASMQSYLRGRPKMFRSLEYAIEWAVRSGQTKNLESAKVSMPGQLKDMVGQIATNFIKNYNNAEEKMQTYNSHIESDTLFEEDEESTSESPEKNTNFKIPDISSYTWRIDLSKTEPYWSGWFQGLSNLFLNNIHVPKLLLLASINGLDTDLTVGQMQGKFQMQVLPRCGHAVQEDVPDQVADVLATFLLRNRLTTSCADFTRTFPAC